MATPRDPAAKDDDRPVRDGIPRRDGIPGPDQDDRDETPTQKLDRNWAELLQEIRVVQTGVQLLTGFLLSLPFQQRFSTINDTQLAIYLAVVCFALLATGLLLAPVSLHRSLFRLHERREQVKVADMLARLGVGCLGLAIVGVATLIFSVTETETAGYVVGAVTFAVLLGLWLLGPLRLRMRARRRRERDTSSSASSGSSPRG